MNEHESRLRTLMNEPQHRDSILHPEDQAAIRWALAELTTQRQRADEAERQRDKALEAVGKWARLGHPILDAIEGRPLGSMGTDHEPFVRRVDAMKKAEAERDQLTAELAAARAEIERQRSYVEELRDAIRRWNEE